MHKKNNTQDSFLDIRDKIAVCVSAVIWIELDVFSGQLYYLLQQS